MDMEKIIYPLGRGEMVDEPTPEKITEWINDIKDTPNQLEQLINGLTDKQLDTPYREEGWTIRQIVHHICDSNINSYIRFKMAATEDNPTVKPWAQSQWAELEDAKVLPVSVSIDLLRALHTRWVYYLRKLTEDELDRTFVHPEGEGVVVNLKENIWNYSWHSRHHIAQIASAIERFSW